MGDLMDDDDGTYNFGFEPTPSDELSGVVKSEGRGRVDVSQGLVVHTVRHPIGEVARRADECNGRGIFCIRCNQNGTFQCAACQQREPMFAPSTNDEGMMAFYKGYPGFLRTDPNTTTRFTPGTDAGAVVNFICNMAGLSKNAAIGRPCISQLERDHETSARTPTRS